MKAKLIKTEVNYILEDDNGVVIASTSLNKEGLSLSIKNCQAIENGYDLDELVIDYIGEPDKKHWYPVDHSDFVAFKDGFEKALEILGDKKFGVNEVVELCKILISNPFETSGKTYQELTDNYIQSLQQTEWGVEIVTVPALSNNGNAYYGEIPKLDSDGCLILKRI